MESQKITLHRALSELKLIDAKILKKINSLDPVGLSQKGKKVNNIIELSEFNEKAKSQYQSIVDLINRKTSIKTAIVKANAETQVEVSGKSMSIADAITFKTVISFKKKLLATLKTTFQEAKAAHNSANERVQQQAIKLAESALQKDNVKIGDSDAIAITQPFMDNYEFAFIDPLKIEDKIDVLEQEIDEFESEVDSVLSEANALTFIEV